MRWPTASGRPTRRPRRPASGAAVPLLLLAAGCPAPAPNSAPPAAPIRIANRPPVIQAVLLSAGGARLRIPQLGKEIEVRVVASDPDGDRLRYAWVTEVDTGRVSDLGAGRARWTPAAGRNPARLRVRVGDSHGAMAERILTAEAEPKLRFAGLVVEPGGKPIARVVVSVDGAQARTDATGKFAILLPDRGQLRFVLNLSHPEFGPVSRVTAEPIGAGRWTMARATLATVDLTQSVQVQVTAGSCATIPSSRVSWTAYPRQHRPVTVTARRALTASAAPEVAAALVWAEGLTACPGGFMLSAGANAFVRGNGTAATSGQVALTQIPAWGGGSMPGDYTVRLTDGTRKVMESFGAATVRVSSGGEALQLAKGQRATLSWPVDSLFLRKGAKPMAEIPLLRYDDATGDWVEGGTARLDRAGTAWTAEVDHLSEFNMDILKVDQACVRIDATALTDPSIELEVTIPRGGFATVRTVTLDLSVEHLHALYNLPTNIQIALRAFRDVAGTPTPLGTFLVNTGGPQVPTDPNRPNPPYTACQGNAPLVDLGATVTIADNDGDPTRPGPFVPVYIGVVNPVGGDLYPAGAGTGFPVVGILDHGSNSVYITGDPGNNRLTGSSTPDATLLGVSNGLNAIIRMAPVDLAASPSTAPMGPAGAADAASAELPALLIRSGPGRDLSLLGAPFTTTHIAYVDYSLGVVIPSSTELGAWSRYFVPGGDLTGLPVAEVEVSMSRFGQTGVAPGGYTREQRYLIDGVTFYHEGHAVGQAVPGSTDKMLYDPGTPWTAIGAATATALGLDDDPVFSEFACGPRLQRVDRVELVAPGGGRYVISNAYVCVDNAQMTQIATNDWVEAVVGASLFRRVGIVVNGPANTFGILRP